MKISRMRKKEMVVSNDDDDDDVAAGARVATSPPMANVPSQPNAVNPYNFSKTFPIGAHVI